MRRVSDILTELYRVQMHFMFQLVSWANVLVLALYFSGPSEDILDAMLIICAIIPWGEVLTAAHYLLCVDADLVLEGDRFNLLRRLQRVLALWQ